MNLVNEIIELFEKKPSELSKIAQLLSSRKFTDEELAKIAFSFVDECFCEYRDSIVQKFEPVGAEYLHFNYIVDAIEMLLQSGLNPNIIVDDYNVMWQTIFIDAPDIAATVLKLLLENGGDPNHFIPAEGESLFETIHFDVSYDDFICTHSYFHTVQCWLLLMAYGACWRDNKEIPLTMVGDNTVEIFKDFKKFNFDFEPLPQVKNCFGCWIMHIYNTETNEEVAMYK